MSSAQKLREQGSLLLSGFSAGYQHPNRLQAQGRLVEEAQAALALLAQGLDLAATHARVDCLQGSHARDLFV